MLTEGVYFFRLSDFATPGIRCGLINPTYSGEVLHNRPSTNSINVAMVARIGVLMASCRGNSAVMKRSRAFQTKQDTPVK
jgi:hypothetical protein